ncbi:MAG: L,D-transpeptidase [Clostridia bacterium]|nr:L,D-transpeptidase [Clostridia bacterium]
MRKKVWLMILLLMILSCAALAEEIPAAFEGYFEKTVFLRPSPAASSESLAAIPALTLLRLEPVDERYAKATYEGKSGYIYYAEVLRVPEGTPVEPYLAYLPESKYLFVLPADGAASLLTIPAETPLTVTAEVDRFLLVEYAGQTGYVYARDAEAIDGMYARPTDAEFTADAAVAARRYPLSGAPVVLTLEAGRACMAEAVCNGYYRVTLGEETVYVPVDQVTTQRAAAATARAALITPGTVLFTAPDQSARAEAHLPQACVMLLEAQENGFQRLRGTPLYVRANDVEAWAVEHQEGLCLRVTADASLMVRPQAGAEAAADIAAGGLLAEVYAVGDWYLLPVAAAWGFLPQDAAVVAALNEDDPMMLTAAVTTQEAAFFGASGAPETVPAGMRLVITGGAEEFWRVTCGAGEGLLPKADVRILGSDTPLTVYTVTAPADIPVMDFPDSTLGTVKGTIPAGTSLRVTGFNRCYLMVTGGGYTGYAPQEGLLTAESRGIPATEEVPDYQLVLDKSTGMCYAFTMDEDGNLAEVVICAEVGIGKRTTPTPAGTFTLGYKERWHTFTHTYTPHTTEYVQARYVHGWPCVERSSASVKTGMMVTGMVTGGCLRSPFEFAEWVYKNCTSYLTQLTIVSGGFEAPEGAEAVQVR